ncbi:DNA-directed RNA polymerases II and V subunit 8A [Camellia lanceoleosa]|uniref:DNA-directed RNA polymerases II and V subunit 8A n=1 Tax=Camellia lanceoleosa TaxID=1840588 RepID=A0ACC0GRD8_9ERIC|nr:DNA-directed RNA polymerases II and V subunit 8A [Camellia lanceoleosa]
MQRLLVFGANSFIMCFLVSRIEAVSKQLDMHMQLNVNTEINPLHDGEKFMMVLASTLNWDGTLDSGYFTQEQVPLLVILL